MDKFVEEKLKEWGLERFSEAFEENEIDRETFLLLDDETMKELMKPCGPRLKLKRELQKIKDNPNLLKDDDGKSSQVKEETSGEDDGEKVKSSFQTSEGSTKTHTMAVVKQMEMDPNVILSFEKKLQLLPKNMATFSSSLLALDNGMKVSTSSNEPAVKQYNKLRELTRRNGLIYCKKVLPVAVSCVTNLSEYFDNYEVLDYEQWKECLEDILIDVIKFRDLCQVLVGMHEDIMASMKQAHQEAQITFLSLGKLQDEFQRDVNKLTKEASQLSIEAAETRQMGAAYGIVTLGIGTIIGEYFASGKDAAARKNLVMAQSKSENAEIMCKATVLVKEILIPALSNFIEGLSVCAEFFEGTRFELEKMKNMATAAKEKAQKRYFWMMQKNAIALNKDCKSFALVLPIVRSDMAAIKEAGPSDKNYVDAWEEQQLKKIEKELGYERSRIISKYFHFMKSANKAAIEVGETSD